MISPFDSEDYVTPQNKRKSAMNTTDFCNEAHMVQVSRRAYKRELSSNKEHSKIGDHSDEEDIEHSLVYSNCRRLIDSESKYKPEKESRSPTHSDKNCGRKIKIKPKIYQGLQQRTARMPINSFGMEQILEDNREALETGQHTSDLDSQFSQIDKRKQAIDKYRKEIIDRFRKTIEDSS